MAAFRAIGGVNRLLRFLAVAVISLAGLTCRDRSLTGPGLPQRARLSVAPHFAVTAGMPLVRLSKVRAEVFHIPSGEVALDTTAFFAPGDLELSLDLSVTMHTPNEQFRLRLSAFDDAVPPQLVYVSDDTVTATPTGLPVTETEVDLDYVGGDTIVAVVAVAPRDTVLTVGDNFTFRSTTKQSDSTVITAQVGWASRDTNAVSINLNSGVALAKTEGANVWIVASTLNSKLDSTRVSITQPVGSVVVLPAAPNVVQGRTLQLSANVKDTHDVPLPTRPVSWSSANTSIATVGPNGLVTGVALGSTTITATSGGVSGSTTVTVTIAPVFRVIVSAQPITPLIVGDNFTGQARLEDDLGKVLTGRTVTWSSATASVATVDQNTGVVTGVSAGTAVISATSEGVAGATTVTVDAAVGAMSVTSATGVFGGTAYLSATLTSRGAPVAGKTIQFTVVGTLVGTAVTNSAGLAEIPAASLGTLAVGVYPAIGILTSGVYASFTGDGTLAPTSGGASLTVQKATATLTLGNLAHTFDGTPKQVTVTTVPLGLGFITVTYTAAGGTPSTTAPSAAGSYDVRASLSNLNYQATDATGVMVISSAVSSVLLTPSNDTVAVGDSIRYSAALMDSTGATISGAITWSIVDEVIATVSTTGWVRGVVPGVTSVIAASDGKADTSSVLVLAGIDRTYISPAAASLTSLNDSLQLSAQSYAGDFASAGSYTWVSRNPAIASVSASGLVVAHANGVTYVVVTEAGGTKDSSQITVQQQVSTVTVTPGSRSLYYGTQFQLSANAVDGRGNPISGILFAWSSTAPAVVSVNEGGLVTTQAATTQASVVAQVRATAGGVIGVSTITAVTAIQLITVTPDTLTLTSLGLPQRYTAVAYDTLDVPMSGITFTWQTSNPSVAPLDSATATTVRAVSAANGVTTIRASAQGVSGLAGLKVQQVLASIEVTPASASVAPTGAISLIARGKDGNNRYINGGSFLWRSDSSTIASVNSSTGVVTGVAVGTANITAETGIIVSNAAAITVTNSVAPSISFGRDTLAVGRGTSTSIPIFLSTPSASPVVVNLAARDTVAYFSVAQVTFPANTTVLNVTLNGRNAGTTQVYATDSAFVYAGDTAAVAVQATMRLAVSGIYVNAGDQFSTQVLLSDPSPAGGTYVTFAYSTAGVASVSPDPAFIPAGQLAADIVVRSIGAGTTNVTPVASGVNGTATYFDAAPAVLTLSVYTLRLGVGQYEPNSYVYTPRGLTASLPVALTTSDTTIARTDASVTIPATSNYAYFTTRGLQPGTARTIATAPGWQPDTFFTTVTTPRLGISGGSTLNTTSPARTLTVYSEDSAGTAHYRINSLVVSLRSTDTSVIKVLDTTVTIGPGQYYNGNGRIAPAGAGGTAWVIATAGGHFADSSQFTVVGPNLTLSFYTYMLGAGQTGGSSGVYVYTPDNVTTPLTVTLTTPDSSQVATPGSVTIPAGTNYAYFEIRGLATTSSAVQLRATAVGYSPDTGYVTVTSPRVTSSGGGTLNNFSDPSGFTIYTTDSVRTAHYQISPVRFTLVSSDTNFIKIDSAAVTVAAGAYYNNSARVRAVGVGSARIYVTGPAGYINDSSMVYTVVTPKLNLSWNRNYVGLRQTSGSNAVYVYTPNNRPDSVHVSIEQKHPEWVRLVGADTSIAIPANRNYEYLAYDGIGLGTDTIIVKADGYEPDTAFITVTTPQFTNGGLTSNATTTTPPQAVTVYATDSVGTAHYVMDTVTFRAVSSDPNVIQPDSEYFHIAKGQYYKPAGVRFVGPGTASMTYTDSAGLYRPTTTGVVTVIGPSLRLSTSSSILGMRQYEQNHYVYTDNNVTGAPLVVHLLSTDTRVGTVPDTLIIPVGLNYAYFRMTAQDTVGTIQIQATATGYSPVNTTLQVTQPKFVISTNGSMWTTSPPQSITVYATDANGTAHYVNDSVPVTLTSSLPNVAAPDSSLIWIVPGQYYNNIARMRAGIVGTTQLTASDDRAAIYSYNPGSASVTVNLPSVSFSYSTDVLGVGQYLDPYVYVPDNTTSPLTVTLTHVGTAKTSIPSTVTIGSGSNSAYLRTVATNAGVDTIIASAPGHNPDTSFITVGTGRIDPVNYWPTTLRAGVDTVQLLLYTRDQSGNARYVNDSTTFALSPTANLQFLSYPGKLPITSLTVPAGQYYMYFYVTGLAAGTGSATITNAIYSPYTTSTLTVSP